MAAENRYGTLQMSERLRTIALLVTPGNRVADIGCDHGYLPIWLLEHHRIPGAIAMDVRPGPLERAKENIARRGMEDRMDVRLSDGMDQLRPGEADSAVIAGMGGKLICGILNRAAAVLPTLSELILEPQSDPAEVRALLPGLGFRIEEEELVLEDGKFYPILRAVPGQAPEYSRMELAYGPVLLRRRYPVLRDFLLRRAETLRTLEATLRASDSERAAERCQEIQEEMQLLRAALKQYEM